MRRTPPPPPPERAETARLLGLIPHATGYYPGNQVYAFGCDAAGHPVTPVSMALSEDVAWGMGRDQGVARAVAEPLLDAVRAGGLVESVTVAAWDLPDLSIASLAFQAGCAAIKGGFRLLDFAEARGRRFRSRMPGRRLAAVDGEAAPAPPWYRTLPPRASDITRAGLVHRPAYSRQAALDSLASGPQVPPQALAAATRKYADLASSPGVADLMHDAGRRAVLDAAVRCRAGADAFPAGDTAWLHVLLASSPWAMEGALAQTEETPGRALAGQRQLWARVTAAANPGHAAGPACLLALTSLQTGITGLAGVALDRAGADCPGHVPATRLAAVMRDAAVTPAPHRGRPAVVPVPAPEIV